MFFIRLLMIGAVCAIAACSKSDGRQPIAANATPSPVTASAANATGPISPSAVSAPSDGSAPADGPCSLLTIAEIHQAFPDPKPGEPEGARSCVWSHRGGRLSIVIASSSSRSLREEASWFTGDSLDPFRRDATANVRFESLRGVGDEAIAVVEAADLRRGILDHTATLLVRRRSRQVTLIAPALVRRDRAEALRLLEQLGAAAAARME